jgi:hypothetical protein
VGKGALFAPCPPFFFSTTMVGTQRSVHSRDPLALPTHNLMMQ